MHPDSAQKGIAGRGVLLDWGGWMESKNASYDAFTVRPSFTTSYTSHLDIFLLHFQAIAITTTELDAVATWQGLDPSSFTNPGDFLVVRTGFTKQYAALSSYEQSILPYREDADAQWIGVEASDATLRWLWDKKLSLVGSDNPAFESVPFNATIDGVPRALHQVFIGGWGQSIGVFPCWLFLRPDVEALSQVEFLDLEALTVACHELKRYSFFFSLQNLNVVGGVASPPNAMAIL